MMCVRANEAPDFETPTPREIEIEELLCRGYSQANIAAMFGRSENTISVHVTSLYRKRKVHSQIDLLLAYLGRNRIFAFDDNQPQRSLLTSPQRAENPVRHETQEASQQPA